MTIHPFYFSLIAFGITILLSLLVAGMVKLVLIIVQSSENGINKLTNGKTKANNR